jgi:hypothetical protein
MLFGKIGYIKMVHGELSSLYLVIFRKYLIHLVLNHCLENGSGAIRGFTNRNDILWVENY